MLPENFLSLHHLTLSFCSEPKFPFNKVVIVSAFAEQIGTLTLMNTLGKRVCDESY
jgi:hypothetical protein